MTREDYLAANPKPLGGGDMKKIGYGAVGRSHFPAKGDKRRRNNRIAYPLPELATDLFMVRMRNLSTSEALSTVITAQGRYQIRKKKRQDAKLKVAA